MIYIFLGLFTLLVFGAVSSDNVMIGGAVGNVNRNSPHIITIYAGIMSIFGLLIATAFFNNAALRDFKNGFNEILFTTPLSKQGFFFGRFFGALILSTIPLLGVFLGIMFGTWIAPLAGWIEPDRFSAISYHAFLNNYLVFILPNMFFAGAVIFAIANKWKNTVLSFVGTLIIIIAYIVSGTLLSDLDSETIAALTDVFGIRTYNLYSKYFTPAEKNTFVIGFEGLIILNRLIWMTVGAVILSLSYFSFSFQEKGKKTKAEKKVKQDKPEHLSMPSSNKSFGRLTTNLQFKSFFVTNFLSISKNITFIILFLFSAIILISNLVGGFEYFGLQSYPVTYKVVDTINNASVLYVMIILVFFCGELVWRDRDFKINEVIDSTPHSSISSLIAKAISLIAITTLLHFFFIFCGVIYQLIMGYTRIELDVYLMDFFVRVLLTYITWSGILILIQVLVNNKYVGYFVSIAILFATDIVFAIFDIESNMLNIDGTPSVQYSDMNGFGPGLRGALWFSAYWILFSAMCLMLAAALWTRGTRSSLKERFLSMINSTSKSYKVTFVSVLSAWILTAGFLYYNTQILNSYKTADEIEEGQVDYENKYGKYRDMPLPKITQAKYNIEIFPKERDVFVKAELKYKNSGTVSIDSIAYTMNSDWDPEILIPGAKIVFEDKDLDFTIFKLDKPIMPGEEIPVTINTKYVTQGFENERGNTSIVENGTFINNYSLLPYLGYSEGNEISDPNTRKKYDLPKKDRMPKLKENCGSDCDINYLSDGRSDFINVETIISTSEDQIAIAPGSLTKQWKEDNRNYYHYKVDHPSLDFYAFISANYKIKIRKWNGIDIEVYYDEKHGVNIEMMLDAVERSLAYYTEHFGPYFHKQCRIIEFPRYSTFAQAFPGTMPYSESFGFITNLEDENGNNVIDAVIAHEMAHQWWAHQLIGAKVQGGTMLSESFSEYSSLMTMKSITDSPMKMREFLKYDHDRYLRGRSGETQKELPLYKVENQTYIHYGKGSVILYALQEYIGEEKVNKAMKGFLEEYRYKGPPYPTTLDFLNYLEPEVPDSLDYLIEDLFKEITLYDNRVTDVSYKEISENKYELTMDLETRKVRSDSLGNERDIAINDWIEIGVFSDDDEENLIYLKMVKINSNKSQYTVLLDQKPAKAGVDPRNLLIDRVYDDNIKPAELKD